MYRTQYLILLRLHVDISSAICVLAMLLQWLSLKVCGQHLQGRNVLYAERYSRIPSRSSLRVLFLSCLDYTENWQKIDVMLHKLKIWGFPWALKCTFLSFVKIRKSVKSQIGNVIEHICRLQCHMIRFRSISGYVWAILSESANYVTLAACLKLYI